MIKSFKHKGHEKFYLSGSTKGIQVVHQRKLSHILIALDNAYQINDLKLPGFNLHPLKGDLKGLWAITVQANWRVTFEFNEKTKEAHIVDYQDHH